MCTVAVPSTHEHIHINKQVQFLISVFMYFTSWPPHAYSILPNPPLSATIYPFSVHPSSLFSHSYLQPGHLDTPVHFQGEQPRESTRVCCFQRPLFLHLCQGHPALSGLSTPWPSPSHNPPGRLLLTIFPAKLTSTKGSTKFFLLLSKPKICLTLSITASSTGEETHLSPLAHASSMPNVPTIYGSLPVGSPLLNQLSYVSAHLLSLRGPTVPHHLLQC